MKVLLNTCKQNYLFLQGVSRISLEFYFMSIVDQCEDQIKVIMGDDDS